MSKNFTLKGVRHDFLSNFFASQNRKTLQGNHSVLCFRKFLVAKKFMDKKAGDQDLLSKTFCLTVSKNFVGEPFIVSLISGIKKFFAYEGYDTVFRRIFFLSHNRKTLQGTILCCVSENIR